MAPQLSRIILVFGVFLFLFLIVRSQVVPEGFGEQGFHRTQGPASVAAAPVRHAGLTACLSCHPDKAESAPHVKKGVRCESCHGPAQAHVDDWEKVKPFVPSSRDDCTRCHAKIVSRPGWYPQIDPKKHNPDNKCIDCHETHPKPEEPATDPKGGQK